MHMQMRNALADRVVHRYEAAGSSEVGRHRGTHHPDSGKQRLDLVWWKVFQIYDVGARHNQHMSFEQRQAIEKRHNVIISPGDVGGLTLFDDSAEDTPRIDHAPGLHTTQDPPSVGARALASA